MAKYDEISSTERLLSLIRNEKTTDYDPPTGIPQPPAGRRPDRRFNILLSLRKVISVGVDLGHDDLKLIKIQQVSDQKFRLLQYARVPFDPEIPRESPRFHEFLKPVVSNFCGATKNIDIWCNFPAARVEIRQIRIPKVPPGQIPNAVYWSYQKLSSFTDRDSLFDFEILGEVEEDDRLKIDVIAYTAPKDEIKDMKDLFNKAGVALSGIAIVPFAFQNLLKTGRVNPVESEIASLYIGRDWSRIDVFSGGSLVLSRGIKAGVKTMLEALRMEIEENLFELSVAKSPDKDSSRIRAIKRKLKRELEQARTLFFGTVFDTPRTVADEGQRFLDADKLFKMIRPALERLIQQVERTLRHFSLQYENARVEKLFVSSGVNPHKRIVEYLAAELGIATEIMDPLIEDSNFTAAVAVPETSAERSAYAAAVGMALSKNALTPNFLYTYKDKLKSVRSQRINRVTFAGFFVLMALCVGVSFWQDRFVMDKERTVHQLRSQLAAAAVRVDKNLILKMVDEIQSNSNRKGKLAEKYLGLAVVREIAQLTPADVRLLDISTTFETTPGKSKVREKGTLILSGIVQGRRLNLESALAGYLMELNNSPMFDQPVINEKSFERLDDKDGLRFTARLKII